MRQLTFLGKKSVPRALRKDHWLPFAKITFPKTPTTPNLGLDAFRKLREYRKMHETAWDSSLRARAKEIAHKGVYYSIEELKEKDKGFLKGLIKKERKVLGTLLGNQKANSVADMAAVLAKTNFMHAVREKRPKTEEELKEEKREKELANMEDRRWAEGAQLRVAYHTQQAADDHLDESQRAHHAKRAEETAAEIIARKPKDEKWAVGAKLRVAYHAQQAADENLDESQRAYHAKRAEETAAEIVASKPKDRKWAEGAKLRVAHHKKQAADKNIDKSRREWHAKRAEETAAELAAIKPKTEAETPVEETEEAELENEAEQGTFNERVAPDFAPITVQWRDILDAEYAESWPLGVVHDFMESTEHQSTDPTYVEAKLEEKRLAIEEEQRLAIERAEEEAREEEAREEARERRRSRDRARRGGGQEESVVEEEAGEPEVRESVVEEPGRKEKTPA